MARPGITYEEVAQAADALLAAGRVGPDGAPTLNALREQLGGTGSPNTIHTHLKAWKARRPAPASVGNELPVGIIRAITDEIDRAQAEARAQIEAKLVAAENEASDLARAGAALEAEAAELRQQLAELTTERDRLAGALDEQQRETARLSDALAREREAAEAARVELAQTRLKVESAEAAASTLRDERAEQIRALEAERAARIEAERKLASAEAARDELRRAGTELAADVTALEDQLERARGVLDGERAKHGETRSALSAEQEKARAAEKRAEDLREREAALRGELQELRAAQRQQSDKAAKGGPKPSAPRGGGK